MTGSLPASGRTKPLRTGTRSIPQQHHALQAVEPLEPRVLLSAFTYQGIPSYFNFPDVLTEFQRPHGAVPVSFGSAAAAIGDVNDDGFPDFIVADPGRPWFGDVPEVPGAVFLYSGATGQHLRTLSDGHHGFGVAVVPLGDVDGDGRGDFAVASPNFRFLADSLSVRRGAVHIISGGTGSVIRAIEGAGATDQLGFSLALIADRDGDGLPDLLIGAPGAADDSGQVLIYSPATGEVLATITGEGGRFGASVSGAVDLPLTPGSEGDGVPEIIIGAPLAHGEQNWAGRVYVYDGATQELRFSLAGRITGDGFGTSVLGMPGGGGGDPHIVVGAPTAAIRDGVPDPILEAGEVSIFRADGLLRGVDRGSAAGARFGDTLVNTGDIDGDGVDDLAVRATGAATDRPLTIYSGSRLAQTPLDFTAARIVPGPVALPGTPPQPDIGPVIFSAGDLDGDGVTDVITLAASNRIQVRSSLAIVPPRLVTGSNNDLSIVYNNDLQQHLEVLRQRFAIISGQFRHYRDIPGLGENAIILGAGDGGLLVAADVLSISPAGGGGPTLGPVFLVIEGVRVPLAEAVIDVVGAPAGQTPDFSTLGPIRGLSFPHRPQIVIGLDGSILLTDSGPDSNPRAWVYRDGVLTFLWVGVPQDMSAAGAILGTEIRGPDAAMLVLRLPDGSMVDIPGLMPFTRDGRFEITAALNDLGHVAGQTPGGALAIWRDGEVTVLAAAPQTAGASALGWSIADLDNRGRIIADHFAFHTNLDGRGPGTQRTNFLFGPGRGLLTAAQIAWDGGDDPLPGRMLAFADEGLILADNSVLSPIDEQLVWRLAPDSPISASAHGVLGVNMIGDVIWLEQAAGGGGEWIGRRIPGPAAGGAARGSDITALHAYNDPRTGQPFFFILGGGKVEWGNAEGTFFLGGSETATPIAGNAVVFTASGQRAVLVGTDANGDIVLLYQSGILPAGDPQNWAFDNLLQSHLHPHGITLPAVAGNITAFGTSWGANHIFFLGEDGRLYGLWIPPGGTQWFAADMNALSESAPFQAAGASLSSFVTPWDTLHINITDASGRVTVIWWDHSFGGNWARTVLIENPGIALDPASVTTFATPWHALNIVGRDADTGQAAAYWWTPATDQWRLDPIHPDSPSEPSPSLAGPIAGAMTGLTQNLYARSAETGELIRLHWSPDDPSSWRVQNLTQVILNS